MTKRSVFERFRLAGALVLAAVLSSFATPITAIVEAPAQAQSRGAKCGNINQRSCTIFDPIYNRRGACKTGLAPTTILGGKCTKTKASVLKDARNAITSAAPVTNQIVQAWGRCFTPKALLDAGRSEGAFFNAIAGSDCLADVLSIAKDNGYGHVAIGTSASLGIGVGGDVETGFAFDVNGKRAPIFYQTKGITFFTIGGGGSIVINLGKGPLTLDNLRGNEHGASVGLAALGGGGGTASFNYQGQLQSVGVILTTGAKGEFGYVRTNTSAKSTSRAAPQTRLAIAPPRDGSPGSDNFDPLVYARSDRSTKLRLCNETEHRIIYAGFGFWDDGSAMGRTGWSAKGWKKLRQGQCQTTTIPNYSNGQAYAGDVYLFATNGEDWWGQGNIAMCVDTPSSNRPLRRANADLGCLNGQRGTFDTATYELANIAPARDTTFTFSGPPDYQPKAQYSATLCNRTSAATIMAGLGIEGRNRTYVHAWYDLPRGECIDVDLTGQDGAPFGSRVYAFATDRLGVWNGMDRIFCLRDPAKYRKVSDTQTNNCDLPEQFRTATHYIGDLQATPQLRMNFTGRAPTSFKLNGASASQN